jgi:hypothetical protein
MKWFFYFDLEDIIRFLQFWAVLQAGGQLALHDE